jgi:hypothetical protein
MKQPQIVEAPYEGMKKRTILWYMAFFGFAINYVIRINASIAIVDMIASSQKKSSSSNGTIKESACGAEMNITLVEAHENQTLTKERHYSFERKILDYFEVEPKFKKKYKMIKVYFRWSTNVMALIGMKKHKA